MRKLILAASLTLAVLCFGATATALVPHHRWCTKLFTPAMDKRAAALIYRGARHVTRANYRLLGRLEACQRNPVDQGYVRAYNHRLWLAHADRVYAAAHPWFQATASWYNDAGSTACGFHAGMGVANVSLPCGTRVTFRYGGRIVSAVVDDRGPYVGGRLWDLNQDVAGVLGFSGVHQVDYRVG